MPEPPTRPPDHPLDDVAGWGALLAEALRETGGALTGEERGWADEVLGITKSSGPQITGPMAQ